MRAYASGENLDFVDKTTVVLRCVKHQKYPISNALDVLRACLSDTRLLQLTTDIDCTPELLSLSWSLSLRSH